MMPGACNGFRREASLGRRMCSPCLRPKCSVFARMCSLSGQMCPVSGQMCPLFPPISPDVSTRPAHVSTRSLDGRFEPPRAARLEWE